MFGSLFGNDKKLLEDERKKADTLSDQVKYLRLQNSMMKDEIDAVYQVLVKKEAYIFKLKKIIIENLYSIDDELREIFKKENYYDPTNKETEQQVQTVFDKSEQGDINTNDTATTVEKNNKMSTEEVKENTELFLNHVSVQKRSSGNEKENLSPNGKKVVNEIDFENKALPFQDTIRQDKKLSLLRMKEERRFLIKVKDSETVSRDLFVFELELKEYTYSTFEAIKQFVNKESFSSDEIHDEIERLASVVAKTKYFKSVFPKDTKEHATNELENYIFQILYPKLFVVDEDVKAFATQLKDRLHVLKQIVTFEMLDIPIQLRKESLYSFAIKEFQKMNDFRPPLLKLQVFQNCANHLIDMFLELVQRNPNSDELFPLFVYTVLQANIDLLKVNVDYIFDYLRKPLKLGQEGFLIINLKAVIKFLSELDGNSLKAGKLEIKESGRVYD